MARFIPWVPMIVALLPLSVANLLIAAQPSAELLPGSTKGYLSIPDLDQLQAKWHETQLGQLVSDPTMEPFVEDLRRQISSRFDQAKTRSFIAGWYQHLVQRGQVDGEAPWSWGKITLLVLVIVVVIGTIVAFVVSR